jgi:hypothetical protein
MVTPVYHDAHRCSRTLNGAVHEGDGFGKCVAGIGPDDAQFRPPFTEEDEAGDAVLAAGEVEDRNRVAFDRQHLLSGREVVGQMRQGVVDIVP